LTIRKPQIWLGTYIIVRLRSRTVSHTLCTAAKSQAVARIADRTASQQTAITDCC